MHDGASAWNSVIITNSAVKDHLNLPCSKHFPGLQQELPEIIHASFHGYLQVFLKARQVSGSLRGHTVGTNTLTWALSVKDYLSVVLLIHQFIN